MPRIINVEPLLIEHIEVRIGDQLRWTLADNVPTAVLIRAFEVIDLERRYREAMEANDAGAMADGIAELERALCHHCGEIIRHTYPGVTDEEVAKTLPTRAQNEILRAFFTIRLQPSGTPSPSSPAEQETTSMAQAAQLPQAKRATRRKAAKRR